MMMKTNPSGSTIHGQLETSMFVSNRKHINIVHDAKSLFDHFERCHATTIFFSKKDRAVQIKQIFSYTIDIPLHDDHLLCLEIRLRNSPIGVYRYVDWPIYHLVERSPLISVKRRII
jgi:hypothetical protein